MKGQSPPKNQLSLFQQRLEEQLNPKHPLYRLANAIPWEYFDKEFERFYSDKGRPAKPCSDPLRGQDNAFSYLKYLNIFNFLIHPPPFWQFIRACFFL